MWEPWRGCFCKNLHCTTSTLSKVIVTTIPMITTTRFGYDTNFTKLLGGIERNSSGLFANLYFSPFPIPSDSHLCLFINLILFSSLPATHLFLFPISLPISSKFSNGRPYCVGKDKPNDLEHRSS